MRNDADAARTSPTIPTTLRPPPGLHDATKPPQPSSLTKSPCFAFFSGEPPPPVPHHRRIDAAGHRQTIADHSPRRLAVARPPRRDQAASTVAPQEKPLFLPFFPASRHLRCHTTAESTPPVTARPSPTIPHAVRPSPGLHDATKQPRPRPHTKSPLFCPFSGEPPPPVPHHRRIDAAGHRENEFVDMKIGSPQKTPTGEMKPQLDLGLIQFEEEKSSNTKLVDDGCGTEEEEESNGSEEKKGKGGGKEVFSQYGNGRSMELEPSAPLE